MPLPSPPSTRLTRVAPHEACLATSTSGMPYLANRPFSLATNSGAASVSAMKPRVALVTSGPAACANAPPGRFSFAAPSNAAVPALALRNLRRLKVPAAGFGVSVVIDLGPFGDRWCDVCPALDWIGWSPVWCSVRRVGAKKTKSRVVRRCTALLPIAAVAVVARRWTADL